MKSGEYPFFNSNIIFQNSLGKRCAEKKKAIKTLKNVDAKIPLSFGNT